MALSEGSSLSKIPIARKKKTLIIQCHPLEGPSPQMQNAQLKSHSVDGSLSFIVHIRDVNKSITNHSFLAFIFISRAGGFASSHRLPVCRRRFSIQGNERPAAVQRS